MLHYHSSWKDFDHKVTILFHILFWILCKNLSCFISY